MGWTRAMLTAIGLAALAASATPCRSVDSEAGASLPGAGRTVVIGDLDGSVETLLYLLREARLADERMHWRGGAAQLVLLGNVIPREGSAGRVIGMLRALDAEAKADGGGLHLLAGDAELHAALVPGKCTGLDERDRRWLARRPPVVVLGETAFMHAGPSAAYLAALEGAAVRGPDRELLELSDAIARVAALHRGDLCLPAIGLLGELGRLSDDDARPDELRAAAAGALAHAGTWMLRSDGPVFHRELSMAAEDEIEAPVARTLAMLGVRRLVIGHVPTPGRRIVSRLQGRLLRVDTANGGGRASWLELGGDAPVAVYPHEGTRAAPREQDAGAGRLYSRTTAEDDAALEEFLQSAEIVADEEIGTGITKPRRLTLRRDGVERHAAFKFVDESISRMVRVHGRMELGFTDRYVYEVAAYRLDRLLGIGAVPVTVLRTVDGVKGSVQQWVEDSINERDRMAEGVVPDDVSVLDRQRTLMHAFDVLIYNTDRNQTNMLYSRSDWKLWLIDHSRAFRLLTDRPPGLRHVVIHPSDDLRRRLEGLTRDRLAAALGDLLSRAQIKAILERRDRLLAGR